MDGRIYPDSNGRTAMESCHCRDAGRCVPSGSTHTVVTQRQRSGTGCDASYQPPGLARAASFQNLTPGHGTDPPVTGRFVGPRQVATAVRRVEPLHRTVRAAPNPIPPPGRQWYVASCQPGTGACHAHRSVSGWTTTTTEIHAHGEASCIIFIIIMLLRLFN